MKNATLSFIFFVLLISCNNTESPAVSTPTPVDSNPIVNDSSGTTKPVTVIGSGLTLEELSDDTIFSDGSKPTSWGIAGITNVKGFKLFLKHIQQLVLNNDREALAKYIKYPLNRTIKTAEAFIQHYDSIFTSDVKISVANINFSQIFRNSKGAMSEGGLVWFAQEGDDFLITAVNY